MHETVSPNFIAETWNGIIAPPKTPEPIIEKLNAAVRDALADPAARTKFAELGQTIYPPERQNPQALAAQQKADIEKWWPIIKAGNLKGE